MIKRSRKFPVKVLTLVFLLVLSCLGTIPSFAGPIQSVETIAVAVGDQSLPPAVWRYDGRAKPDSASGYHPFDFDGTTLTLYWEQVMDGKTPVSTYEIYRAGEKPGVDWSDPSAWGWNPILKITGPATVQANWKTYATCSAERLLMDVDPGREYVYGVRAVSGNKTSGISRIPYPFRVSGPSLVGLAQFYAIPGLFTEGKYGLEIVFSGSVNRSLAINTANYTVFFNNARVNLRGPDGGSAFFDPVKNSVIMDTDLDAGGKVFPELLKITANNIAGLGGQAMNISAGGPINFISGNVSMHSVRENSREWGEVISLNPISGQPSEYLFRLPVSETMLRGGQIVITFPSDYTIDGSISVPDTSSRPGDVNGDINGCYDDRKVKISGVQVYPASNMVILTLSDRVMLGEQLAFVLDHINNPETVNVPGQAYLFSVKAPSGSTNPIILPAFVSTAGNGSLTVAVRDGNDPQRPLVTGVNEMLYIRGPGYPAEGYGKTDNSGSFIYSGLRDNVFYRLWISSVPPGFKKQFTDMPLWLPPSETAKEAELDLAGSAVPEIKTIKVTINNLPADLNSKAVVFAAGHQFYDETGTPVEIIKNGETRVYRLNLPASGEYTIGVYPFLPPVDSSVDTFPPAPAFIAPMPLTYRITGDMAVNVNLPAQSQLTDVTVQLRDENNVIPGSGNIFAYSPNSPDAAVTAGMIDSSGQATLKLKKGTTYMVSGGSPGMPQATRKRVYVDNVEGFWVDGALERANYVSLKIPKPGRKISGYIRYKDGTAASAIPVIARSNGTAAGVSQPCYTDRSGHYTLWVAPGNWTVEVYLPDAGVFTVSSKADTTTANTIACLTIPSLENLYTLTGKVTDHGDPVQGAMIWMESGLKSFVNGTTTGPDGSYMIKFDGFKAYGSTIRCVVPGFGELVPKNYQANVDFTLPGSDFTVDFGRPVSGYVSIYQSKAAAMNEKDNKGFHNIREVNNASSIIIKAPEGLYSLDCYINGIGHIRRDKVYAPGSINLKADTNPENSVNLDVVVTGGGGNAWVSVTAISGEGAFALGKMSNEDVASFRLPRETEVSISVFRNGYFHMRKVLNTGTAGSLITMEPIKTESGKNVLVSVTGAGTSLGNNDYLVWAKNPASGVVVSTRFYSLNDFAMKLPFYDNWLFRASTQGYTSDEQAVLVTGSKVVSIPLKNVTQSKVSNTVIKPVHGGVVTNGILGIKFIIPPKALGSSNSDYSVMTYSSSAVTDTTSFKAISTVRNISVRDIRGNNVTTLNKSMEVVLDYSIDYATWPADQRDSIARYLQLAYWDTALEDWVVIPATNDLVSHTLRGLTKQTGEFTVVYPQVLALSIRPASSDKQSSLTILGAVEDVTLDNAIQESGVTGQLSLQASSLGTVLALKPEQIDRILLNSKPLEIKISDITFNCNASVLKLDNLRRTVTHVSLGVQKISLAATRELVAKATNSRKYNMLSDVYSFTARTLMNAGTYEDIGKFNGLMRVSIPVPSSSRDAALNGKIMGARFNDRTKAWETVNGTYNPTAGTFQFNTDVFSYWVLIAEK